MKNITVIVLLLALIACDDTFSDGERIGVVTKLSYKGLINKSWEGELAMANIKTNPNGGVGNTFAFSVRDVRIQEQLQDAMTRGVTVRLHYRQVVMNTGCTQDSDYIVTGVATEAH